jgi:dolichol-phosphate mannosyltransferase
LAQSPSRRPTLSIVVPAYNEERSLAHCIERVLQIERDDLGLEILIVDDASRDATPQLADQIAAKHPQVNVVHHERNRGKGAALHTGFRHVTGDFVAVQDADLEYDPEDLIRLLVPLREGKADVVLGSRFLNGGERRVLYFWHSVGNRVLTLLSNMCTDLNLSDMETCYKVFRRDVLQRVELFEQRFGFEPEIVASISKLRLRVYEMGISYAGRTYEEGKKIGARDGFRALYCILHYNLPFAPNWIQSLAYILLGGAAAALNLLAFLALTPFVPTAQAAAVAFAAASAVNYWLCVMFLFRHRSRWSRPMELLVYGAIATAIGIIDVAATLQFVAAGLSLPVAKLSASAIGLLPNYLGRRHIVFRVARPGPWAPSN